jgi:hypothetical protein
LLLAGLAGFGLWGLGRIIALHWIVQLSKMWAN